MMGGQGGENRRFMAAIVVRAAPIDNPSRSRYIAFLSESRARGRVSARR